MMASVTAMIVSGGIAGGAGCVGAGDVAGGADGAPALLVWGGGSSSSLELLQPNPRRRSGARE
jgi:hypothetical protein